MEHVHRHERAFRHISTLETVASNDHIGCWVGQFTHFERHLGHLARFSLVVGRDGEHHVFAHGCWRCNIVAGTFRHERTTTHTDRHGIGRNARHTDAHRVLETGVEHVHQVGGHRRARRCGNHGIFLREVAAHRFACGVARHQITTERMFADASCGERIFSFGIDFRAVHVDFGLHRRIDGCHHDVGIEDFARVERRFFGNDKGIEFVHTNVFYVDVRHERMQHFTLGIAHVALQFRQQRHGSGHGHIFEHIFLPVFS